MEGGGVQDCAVSTPPTGPEFGLQKAVRFMFKIKSTDKMLQLGKGRKYVH